MRDIGAAVGWTLYEHGGCYYVRAEQVVAMLSNSGPARELLAAMLSDSTPPLDEDEA